MQTVWHDVNTKLIAAISEEITVQLPDDLVARAEESVTLESGGEGEASVTKPDVIVKKTDSWKAGIAPSWSPEVDESLGARIATPIVVNLVEETERWIEISDAKGNLITVIEILSPANKTPFGRDRFERKLKKFWERAVNTVEVDLIRGGISADKVRPGLNWPTESQIIVTRGAEVNFQEVYPCPLREPLPVFLIPLRSSEPDLPFDLQPLINRCHEKGRYWLLNYDESPNPRLNEDDLNWARGILDRN